MFGFLRGSGVRSPSAALRRALEADNLPPGTDIPALGVVESAGRYSGRRVTYFRVFDPRRVADRALDLGKTHTYQALDAHLDLVVRAGFIERDGTVVIFFRAPAAEAAVPLREGADRAAHADYERYVADGGR